MGDFMTHHFAHSKGDCDETVAFMTGMFNMIMQFVQADSEFHAPTLAVSYRFPSPGFRMTKENVGKFVEIVPEDHEFLHNYKIVKKGATFDVDCAELAYDKNNHIEAIIISVKQRKLAIRVQPPQSCKDYTPLPYEDLPTLVFDASDIDFNHMKSEDIKTKMFNNPRLWSWLANKRIEEVYDAVYDAYQKWLVKAKAREEAQRKEREKLLAARQKQLQAQQAERDRLLREQAKRDDKWQNARTRYPGDRNTSTGYVQAVTFFEQGNHETHYVDAYGKSWVKCSICGEIRHSYELPHSACANHGSGTSQ
jgi:hypothetical protein